MERFYLKNVAKYHSLVNALDPTPKPRESTGEAGPNMVVDARIRPLSKDEGFPSAIFPRSIQENVVDIHDLYCKLCSVKNWMNDLIVNVALKPLYIHEEGGGNKT